MVYPAEVRALMRHTGLSWEEVSEPYPEVVLLPSGQVCTFEWALLREKEQCAFLKEGHCRVYSYRPWICRTYPFFLAGGKLLHADCPGIGKQIGEMESLSLARDLLSRREIENDEEDRIHFLVKELNTGQGKRILIDGEGVKILDE
jgi:Fe-S-cluster containining protein